MNNGSTQIHAHSSSHSHYTVKKPTGTHYPELQHWFCSPISSTFPCSIFDETQIPHWSEHMTSISQLHFSLLFCFYFFPHHLVAACWVSSFNFGNRESKLIWLKLRFPFFSVVYRSLSNVNSSIFHSSSSYRNLFVTDSRSHITISGDFDVHKHQCPVNSSNTSVKRCETEKIIWGNQLIWVNLIISSFPSLFSIQIFLFFALLIHRTMASLHLPSTSSAIADGFSHERAERLRCSTFFRPCPSPSPASTTNTCRLRTSVQPLHRDKERFASCKADNWTLWFRAKVLFCDFHPFNFLLMCNSSTDFVCEPHKKTVFDSWFASIPTLLNYPTFMVCCFFAVYIFPFHISSKKDRPGT